MSEPISRLAEVLRAGRFAITAEIAPPAAADPKALLDRALPLRGLAASDDDFNRIVGWANILAYSVGADIARRGSRESSSALGRRFLRDRGSSR